MTFYASYGLDLFDLRKLVRTEEGADRVCRVCLAKADVVDARTGEAKARKSAAEIEAVMEANGLGVKSSLAWVLADLDDAALFRAPVPDKEQDADPLASTVPVTSSD